MPTTVLPILRSSTGGAPQKKGLSTESDLRAVRQPSYARSSSVRQVLRPLSDVQDDKRRGGAREYNMTNTLTIAVLVISFCAESLAVTAQLPLLQS